jgi:hypothetical protein
MQIKRRQNKEIREMICNLIGLKLKRKYGALVDQIEDVCGSDRRKCRVYNDDDGLDVRS